MLHSNLTMKYCQIMIMIPLARYMYTLLENFKLVKVLFLNVQNEHKLEGLL